ncbi:MAG: GMC family oxidoreductase N-terminal domain-containing protein [Raineya sp.]|jgi:choline dehydrogenase|nr:GMC family oxidoreductase N-terminal domain-containing protein [Raineya sp.]
MSFRKDKNYDYIIVGAGSAGCVLANRLSANPENRVLLIEAGGKDTKMEIHIPAAYSKLNRSSVDWAFYSEPQRKILNRKIFQPRGKVLGGSSSTNAMAYIRGNAEDYNDWASMGCDGWSFEEVLPYFIKSEHNEDYEKLDKRFHGQGGLLNIRSAYSHHSVSESFIEACIESGMPLNPDFNGESQEGVNFFQFTIKNQKRHSTATAFLKPIQNRTNLDVLTNAHVGKILIEEHEACGVEMISENGSYKIYCDKEVIVSAGAFGSPQLLMLSGIGDATFLKKQGIEVKKDLIGVGKNLQDHCFAIVSSSSRINTANHDLKIHNQLKGVLEYFLFKKGVATASPLEANAFMRLDSQTDRPDMQFHFVPAHLGGYGVDLYNLNEYPTHSGYTILATLLRPESRGYVSIQSKNPLDAPVIQPNYLDTEKDQKTLIQGVKKAFEVMQAKAFDKFRKEVYFPKNIENETAILEHIHKTLECVYHPIGTCKMGTENDEMSVVNSHLQVKGVRRLRVVDASIMPQIITGNTNAPVIMIAEKAADMILKTK